MSYCPGSVHEGLGGRVEGEKGKDGLSRQMRVVGGFGPSCEDIASNSCSGCC